MLKRREFLYKVIQLSSLFSLGVCSHALAWPKGDKVDQCLKVGGGDCSDSWPEVEVKDKMGRFDLQNAYGCSLSASAANSVVNQFQLLNSCGNPYIDRLMFQESQVLTHFTGFQPGFAFLNDRGAPNAFATAESLLGRPHGTVLFGVNLVHKEIKSLGSMWDAAVVFIMAHEWGHIAEFQHGLRENAKEMELLSDYIGGWYLGMKISAGMRFAPQGAARSVFEKGDFNFNDPQHHGTPSERLEATEAGFKLGTLYRVKDFRRAFSEGREEIGL